MENQEPEVPVAVFGVCPVCGGAVMNDGSHIDYARHSEALSDAQWDEYWAEQDRLEDELRDADREYEEAEAERAEEWHRDEANGDDYV